MKTKFKVGDMVICNNEEVIGDYSIEPVPHKVIEVDDDETIKVDGYYDWFNEYDWDLATNSEHGTVQYAESLVGTTVKFNRTRYMVEDWTRITKGQTKGVAKVISDIVNKHGFCFCAVSGETLIPVSKIKTTSPRIVLNNEYSGVVRKDDVVVGCQTIPYEKILEIVKIHNELYA